MPIYALLQNPGHNRVYFQSARVLSLNELRIAAQKLSAPVVNAGEKIIGGVSYIAFETAAPLTPADCQVLSRLSFTYAIFLVSGGDGAPLLTPLPKDGAYYLNDDVTGILKYTGKTNELFTRFMLNLAVFHSGFDHNAPLSVLDPVCGKGTTLFDAMLCGYHAYGVDIDEKAINEAAVFFKKYMENARYKHEAHTERLGVTDTSGKKHTATRYRFSLARSKADQKAGMVCHAEMIAGDTGHMRMYYKKDTFHAIVGDLPYGIQHKGKAEKNPHGARNAMGMLQEALPGWVAVLKKGGTMVLAWNLFLIPRTDMVNLFRANGLVLPEGEIYQQLAHRVDQAIERDLIVGVKA